MLNAITLILINKQRILHSWLFHMKFIKRAFGEFDKFHMNDHESNILFIMTLSGHYFNEKNIVDTHVLFPLKVLCNVWS